MSVSKAYYDHIGPTYRDALYSGPTDLDWGEVFINLIWEKEQIVAQIQNSSVSGLSEHLFRHFIRKFTPKPKSNIPDGKNNHDSNQ